MSQHIFQNKSSWVVTLREPIVLSLTICCFVLGLTCFTFIVNITITQSNTGYSLRLYREKRKKKKSRDCIAGTLTLGLQPTPDLHSIGAVFPHCVFQTRYDMKIIGVRWRQPLFEPVREPERRENTRFHRGMFEVAVSWVFLGTKAAPRHVANIGQPRFMIHNISYNVSMSINNLVSKRVTGYYKTVGIFCKPNATASYFQLMSSFLFQSHLCVCLSRM